MKGPTRFFWIVFLNQNPPEPADKYAAQCFSWTAKNELHRVTFTVHQTLKEMRRELRFRGARLSAKGPLALGREQILEIWEVPIGKSDRYL